MLEVHEGGPGQLPWAVAIAPDEAETRRLIADLRAPASLLEHALDRDELPRLDRDGDTVLAVLRVPHRNPRDETRPYGTEVVAVLLTAAATVIVAREELAIVRQLGEWIHGQPGASRERLLSRALHLVAAAFMAEVRHVDVVVDRLEDRLQRSMENREVLALLKCQKGLVFFSTALESTVLAIERLLHAAPKMQQEDQELFADALVEIRQALSMSRMSANVLGEMMDAFASIISNNLNVVMKLLASITIVLTLPATVASFYGMNVGLPGARSPLAFVGLVGGSIVVSIAVALVFRRRRWL